MDEARPDSFPKTERFEERGFLGRGGMGVVFRAFDRRTQREVALKTLPAPDPEQVFQLKQEFRVVADLIHESLVQLHDLVMDGGSCFFTMELLEGPEFLGWVDVGDDPSAPLPAELLERIARGLVQIAGGVSAIHDAGMLHRDIKPSNIRVRRSADGDRLVLLDFGIVAPIVADAQARRDREGTTGTPAYMSPEALRGGALGPASDWYSVGCVAYEALTGRRPFARSDRERGEIVPPSEVRAGVPAWLDDLIASLLYPEPSRRADGTRLREILGSVAPDSAAAASPTPRHVMPWGVSSKGGDGLPFVGRRAEMEELSRHFAKLQEGVSSVVHISGDSGIGKSELIHRFAERAENEAGAVTLRGRCHLHESVPYKAVDQVVDDLTRFLLREETPAQELVPRDADALCRLFPVLRRVPEFAALGEAADEADPHMLRRRGAGALRGLLAAIGARFPLVVWIDDLQWGDEDSAALIREWLRPGAMPRVLLVLSYRDESADENPLLESMRGIPGDESAAERVELAIEPLGAHESSELTSQLLRGHSADDSEVRSIVAEAAGSPFFISQLARHLADLAERGGAEAPIGQVSDRSGGGLRLADVIGLRLDALSPLERRVVEVASVAVSPLDTDRALAAAGGGASDRSVLQTLQKLCLLRIGADAAEPTVQTYHAKIAEATIARLPQDELRGTHRILADMLGEDPRAEPEDLVPHLLGAGDLSEAARAAAKAGDRAADALAFGRAARHYELALEYGGPELHPHQLRVRLAEALVNAGQTPRAAEWFEEAADELERERPGSSEVSLLRRQAAQHFIQCGLSVRGSALMRSVLSGLGVRMPETTPAAVRALVWNRLRLRLRGTKPAPFDADVSPEALERMDAIWSAGRSNAMNSPILSGALVTRFVLHSLDLGEPRRIVAALGMEATWCAGVGGRMLRRVDPLLEQIDALAEEHGTSYEHASRPYFRSVVAWTRGDWARSASLMAESIRQLRTECPGTAYEVSVGNIYLLSALAMRGELSALVDAAREELRIAEDRCDLFAQNACLLGEQVLAWLVADEPETALRRADEVVAAWSKGGFFTQHYHYLIATVQAFLYRGEAWKAWQRVVEIWPDIETARILDMENTRIQMLYLRGRAALAAASDAAGAPQGLAKWSHRRLHKRAADDARRIARSTLPFAAALAATLRSAIAGQSGSRDEAVRELETALAGFDASGMPVHREGVRARLGATRSAADEVTQAHAWLTDRGVVRPDRLVDVFAPPLGDSPV